MFTCRECDAPINPATEICPYCGADLTEGAAALAAEPTKKRSAAKLALFYAALLTGVLAIFWYALPERSSDREASAIGAMHVIRAGLADYTRAEGKYPQSLEALGDRIREAARNAQREGYQLLYSPGAPAADGRVHSYTLLARPGNYGFRNLYTDETGLVRATRENRPATAQDPLIE